MHMFSFILSRNIPMNIFELEICLFSTFQEKLSLNLNKVNLSVVVEPIALRTDDVSVHVCPHLPFILAFPTIENPHLKSLESQFRFVCPHFGSINSNCALRYCKTVNSQDSGWFFGWLTLLNKSL